jgi:hypothetical protein
MKVEQFFANDARAAIASARQGAGTFQRGLDRRSFVGVGSHSLAKLIVCALHLRMVAIDMGASEPEQFFVVGPLQVVSARTVDRTHGPLLS